MIKFFWKLWPWYLTLPLIPKKRSYFKAYTCDIWKLTIQKLRPMLKFFADIQIDRQTKTDKQTGQKLQVTHLPVWRYKMKYFVAFWGATLWNNWWIKEITINVHDFSSPDIYRTSMNFPQVNIMFNGIVNITQVIIITPNPNLTKLNLFVLKKANNSERKRQFELSPLILWIALLIVKTYSEFQVNIFSNNRDITNVKGFLSKKRGIILNEKKCILNCLLWIV